MFVHLLYGSDVYDMGKLSEQRQAFAEQFIRESAYAAVLQVLSEHGLEKLTVQRVAVAAKLGTGTLYNYFKDKDALLVYAAIRLFDEIRQRQQEAIGRVRPPDKKLLAYVTETFVFFASNIAFFRFLDQAQVYSKIDMPIKYNHLDEENRVLSAIIQQGIKAGLFKPVNVKATAAFFQRAVAGTLCINTELEEFDPKKEARTLTKMLLVHLS